MGILVDLTKLVTQLLESVQDRKFAAELREIHRMIGSLQLEHAAVYEQNLDLRTEKANLKIENMQLKEQMAARKQRRR
jgi:hypothetical protein